MVQTANPNIILQGMQVQSANSANAIREQTANVRETTARKRDEENALGALTVNADGSPAEGARESLAKLAVSNPMAAQITQSVIQSQSQEQAQQYRAMLVEGAKETIRARELTGSAREAYIQGQIAESVPGSPDEAEWLELRNQTPEQQDIALSQAQRDFELALTPIDEVFKGLKPKDPIKLGEGEALFNTDGTQVARNDDPNAAAELAIKQGELGVKQQNANTSAAKATLEVEKFQHSLTNPRTDEPPKGYRWTDPQNPTELEAIPGGPASKLNATDAGKAALLTNARAELVDIESLVFDADGSLNRQNIANAVANTPGTDGRELNQRFKNAIEARLRLESGAAVPETEVVRAMARFMPQVGDTAKQVRQKIERSRKFLSDASRFIDPSGNLGISSMTDPAQPAPTTERVKPTPEQAQAALARRRSTTPRG